MKKLIERFEFEHKDKIVYIEAIIFYPAFKRKGYGNGRSRSKSKPTRL